MTTILTKKKDTAGAPAPGDLTNSAGGAELAVNTATKRLYTKDSGGNIVEIGTNPSSLDVPVVISGTTTSAALRITQLGTGNALLVEDSTNPDSTPFVIDASGNVGIGTTAPETKLHIKSASTSLYSTVIAANKSLTGFGTVNYTVTDINTDGTFAANQWLVTRNGGVEQYAYMGAVANSAGFAPDIVFGQRTAAAAMTERMRIDSSGNVGIGVTPAGSAKLEIKQAAATQQGVWVYASANDSQARLFCDGTSAGLAASFTSTGSYLPMTFYTSGAERMRIDSSGNVGIGTAGGTYGLALNRSSNNGSTIQINNSTLNASFLLQVDTAGTAYVQQQYAGALAFATSNSEKMRIDSSGKLLIGTSSSITTNNGESPYTQTSGTDSRWAYQVATFANSSGTQGGLYLAKSRGTSVGSYTAVQSGDSLGRIAWSGADGTNMSSQAAEITVQVDAAVSTGIVPGRLLFFTSNTSGALTERMRIDSSGNVGIGTSSPSNTLHVVGSELLTSTSAETKFNINNTGTGGLNWWIGATNNSSGAVGGGKLAFYDQTSNALRMVIDNSGNVGIGTSSPGNRLHISGATNATSGVSIQSTGASGRRYTNYSDSAGGLVWFDDTASAERMRIDSSGNVGIGTSSPSGKLHVAGGANTNDFLTSSTGTTYLIMGNVDGGANAKYSYVGAASQYLLFGKVNDDFATRTEYMRIDNSGNVGIGTSSPSGRLNLATGASTSCTLRFTSNSTGSGAGDRGRLDFYSADNSGTAYQLGYMDYDRSDGTGTASYIAWANRKAGTVSESMRIDSSGNLLIGTTAASTQTTPNVTLYGGNTGLCLRNASTGTGNNVGTDIFLGTGGDLNINQRSAQPIYIQTSNSTKLTIDTTGNLQVQAGAVMPYAPAPASISTTATLTNANIQAQIINTTGTSYTVTMPLGTTLETLATWATTNVAYDFFVINTASGTITMAVNTGVTSLGGLTIATGVSAQFRIRRTAANTFVLYRLG